MEKTFYFTYGCGDGQPFRGGWTIVIAPDMKTACKAFRIYHPDKAVDTLNCASVYTEEQFKKTVMYRQGSNIGVGCREIITISRTAITNGKENET